MDISQILDIALPVVYILVGLALVWFLIELIKFLRNATKTVNAIKEEIDPTLAHVQTITAALEPVVARVDPLVERVSLTVDAANLEIMRVDQILENVTDITGSLSSATDALDTAANAPMKLVNTASEKVRGVFKSRKASDESIALGAGKAEEKKEALPVAEETPAVEEETDGEAEIAEILEAAEEALNAPAEEPAEEAPAMKSGYFTYTPDQK